MQRITVVRTRLRARVRSRLGGGLVAAGVATIAVGMLVPAGSPVAAQGFTGQAAPVFVQDLEVGGQPGFSGPVPCGATVTTPAGAPCNLSLPANPLGSASLLTNTVTTSGDTTNGSSTATSQLASITLLPAATTGQPSDVLDATVLSAQATASCSGGAAAPPSASSSIATLTIDGTPVIGPNGPEQGLGQPLDVLNLPNQTLDIPPAQTGLPAAAVVTFDYQVPGPGNTETVSPLVVSFPAGGPLSAVIQGTIFVSYAQADMECAGAATPTATATSTATGTATPTATATATPSGTPTPSGSPTPGRSPHPTPHGSPTPCPSPSATPTSSGPGSSQEDCHESDQAQCVEHESFPPEKVVSGCPVHPPSSTPVSTHVGPVGWTGYLPAAGTVLIALGLGWMRWEVRRRRASA